MLYLYFILKIVVLYGAFFIFSSRKFRNAIIILIGQAILVSVSFFYIVIPILFANPSNDISMVFKLIEIANIVGTLIFAFGFIVLARDIKYYVSEK